MSNHGIINYPDAQAVQKQLDELIKKPIYSISPEALKKYEEEYGPLKAISGAKDCEWTWVNNPWPWERGV